MRLPHARQSGMTLIELLVAATITAALFIGLATFTANYLGNNAVEMARSELLTDNMAILDQITDDIRQSSGADVDNRYADANAPEAPVDQLSWHSDASTLVLATVATDTERNILYEDEVQYIPSVNNTIYFASDGVLYRRILAGSMSGNTAVTTCPVDMTECTHDRTMSRHVSQFSLRYLDEDDAVVAASDARSVEVTLGLSTDRYGQTITSVYTVRTVFRN